MHRVGCLFIIGALALSARADISNSGQRLRPATCGLLRTVAAPAARYQSVKFSPRGRALVLATDTGEVQVLRPGSWKELRSWNAAEQRITDLAFSPDGKRLVTCGYGSEAVVWDFATGREAQRLTGHTSNVMSSTFDPKGRWVVTCGYDGSARIWNPDTGKEVTRINAYCQRRGTIVFSPDGTHMAVTRGGRMVVIFSTKDWKQVGQYSSPNSNIVSLAVDPEGTRFFAGDGTGKIIAVKLDGTETTLVELQGGQVGSLDVNRDGTLLLAAVGRDLALIDLRRKSDPVWLKHHSSTISEARFSPDQRRIVSVAGDGHLKIWGYRPGGMKGVQPKGYFGVTVSEVPGGAGVEISSVMDGTAASRSGVREGDIIVSVGGIRVQNVAHAVAVIGQHSAGEEVEIIILRGGKEEKLNSKLGERPEGQ
jgi:WD40 repeat protein